MAPGAIYLGLVAGRGLGAAAQWVTIVLFAEVARRSFLPLKRQEIYVLFYVAGGLAAVALSDRGISGGPFGYLIWNQYFIQTPQAAAIANEIPRWVVPPLGSEALVRRTFFHADWAVPIIVLVATQLLERLSWIRPVTSCSARPPTSSGFRSPWRRSPHRARRRWPRRPPRKSPGAGACSPREQPSG
jgi:hypothetical protein